MFVKQIYNSQKDPKRAPQGPELQVSQRINSLIFAPGACEAALERTEAAPKWEGAKASGRR